jgi:MFS family permease
MVPLFVVAHLMHHVPGFIIQALMPSIRDHFGLDYTSIGWLNSAYNVAYGAANLPAGWLGGRVPTRILIVVGVSGVAVFGLLVGLSSTYAMIVAALLLMGIAGGGYHSSASPMVSEASTPETRGRVLGIHQLGGTLANSMTPLLVAGISAAAAFLTWRGPFIILCVPILVYGIYLYVILRRNHLGDTPRRASAAVGSAQPTAAGYMRRMAAFMIVGASVQVLVFSSISFVPLLVTDQYKAPEWLGSVMLAVPHFTGLWAGPLGGHISDRIGRIPTMLAVALAAGPAVFLLSLGTHWWLLPLALIAMGACMYVAMPVSESYVISNASPRNRSAVLGIYYFVSRGGPGLVSPIIGRLVDTHSFSLAYMAVAGTLLVIAATCSFLLWGKRD